MIATEAPPTTELVITIDRVRAIIREHITQKTSFGFDTETYGLKLENAKVVGVALSSTIGTYYFPLGHTVEMRDPWGGRMEHYFSMVAAYDDERARGIKPNNRMWKTKPTKPKRITFEEQVANLETHPDNLPAFDFWAAFSQLFSVKETLKVAHNLPFDWRVVRREMLRFAVKFPIWPTGMCDSLILAYSLSLHLARAYGGLGLDIVAEKVLGVRKDETELNDFFDRMKVKAKRARKPHLFCAPMSSVARYAGQDAFLARRLAKKLLPELKGDPGCTMLYERELALVRTTVAMESAPKWVDLVYAKETFNRGTEKLKELRENIFRFNNGEEFDIDSPEQLGGVLRAAGIKLPYSEATQKAFDEGEEPKKILYSTEAKTIEAFRRFPIVGAVLRYRALNKRINTDMAGILRFTHPIAKYPGFGALYPNLSQTTARTGRYASQAPNGQNQTRDDENDEWAADFSARKAMRSSPVTVPCTLCAECCGQDVEGAMCSGCLGTGWKKRLVLSVDLKQIEPRWTAHLSRDPNLINVYLERRDVYVEIGKVAFDLDHDLEDKAWKKKHPDERQGAKSLVLAILYGAGTSKVVFMVTDAILSVIDGRLAFIARRLAAGDLTQEGYDALVEEARILNIRKRAFRFDINDAKRVLQRVRDRFPRIFQYRDYLERSYEKHHHIRNSFGRKLYLAYADRTYTLLNAMVQSSAADMLKQATLDCDIALRAAGIDCKLIFSIHDELLFDIAAQDLARARAIIVREMTKFELRVPLEVDLSVTATTWAGGIEISADVNDPIPWEELAAAA